MKDLAISRRQCLAALFASAATLVLATPAKAFAKAEVKCSDVPVRFWYSTKTHKEFQFEYQCIPYKTRLYHKNNDELIETRMGYDPDGNYCLLKKYYRRWYTA